MQGPCTGRQVRAARALLRMKQEDLAAKVGVHKRTIRMLERHDGPITSQRLTVEGIYKALAEAGVVMERDDNGLEVVALRPAGQTTP